MISSARGCAPSALAASLFAEHAVVGPLLGQCADDEAADARSRAWPISVPTTWVVGRPVGCAVEQLLAEVDGQAEQRIHRYVPGVTARDWGFSHGRRARVG